MYPEHYWQWHLWIFPIVMPIFWIVMIGLCLYFIFGRRGAKRPWVPGRALRAGNRPGYPEKALRQRGDQPGRVRADEAGYYELRFRWGEKAGLT